MKSKYKTMRLIVIRHGQTTGDVEDRYGGAYDDVLSPEGEAQVQQLVAELAGQGIQQVFTSPLKRAQQTAQGVAAQAGCPVTVIADFKERDQYGALTGMTKTQARQQHPDWVEALKDRLNTLPGAESYAAASARTSAAFADVLAQVEAAGHDCVAIVWHGGGMRVLFRDILQWGELTQIGDCCWVELQRPHPTQNFTIKNSQRIGFEFGKQTCE